MRIPRVHPVVRWTLIICVGVTLGVWTKANYIRNQEERAAFVQGSRPYLEETPEPRLEAHWFVHENMAAFRCPEHRYAAFEFEQGMRYLCYY